MMEKKSLESRIYLQKLSFLYSELPKGVLATLTLGLILVVVLKESIAYERLAIWYGLTCIVSLFRFVSFFSFRSDQDKESNIDRHSRILFAGTLSSALIWGASSFYIFPDSDELKLVIVFFIAGLSAGATGVFAPLFKFYTVFVLVMMMPFILVFSLETSSYSSYLSIALLFYLFVITSSALKINKNYDENLRLGFKNEQLVEELKTKASLAEQSNAAKSMFLSTMSHEIRTPLNAILGYISLLRKKETDREKQDKLEIIWHSSHQLLGVINDILDFSKISGGKLRLAPIKCDLKKEIKQLLEFFLPLCKEKDLVLEVTLDKGIPLCVITDILRVKQILTNLLSNAIKFTPEGKKISLVCRYEKPKIIFEVRDEGIGIDKKHQKIIFESFEQADSSTTRKYGGTGLGLAISYQLSLLLNGVLKVSSEIDKGSTFSFSIETEDCDVLENDILETEVSFDHEKVLVAEDNKTNQMLAKILLEDMGLDVVMVKDGREAVEAYNDDFALVLMDINMPNMNGSEAMKIIKGKSPQARIVALTANALSEDKEEYLRSGFDGYLSKPIDTEALSKILVRMIKPT